MPPKKHALPTKTTQGSSPDSQIRPMSNSPPVLEESPKQIKSQWPFIGFIELQDRNYKLGLPHQYPKTKEKDINGSEPVISKGGYDIFVMMHIEVKKRTPESDWNQIGYMCDYDCAAYYGIMEVLENQILEYERERKKSHFKFKFHSIVEALVFFLNFHRSDWSNVCDHDRVEGLTCLIGTLFIDWLHELEKEIPIGCWLAPPDKSPLKNLGLIMGLAFRFAEGWKMAGNMKLCFREIKKIAKSRGIQLRDFDGPIKERDKTWMLDFGTELEIYVRENGGRTRVIGGNEYILNSIPGVKRQPLDKADAFET